MTVQSLPSYRFRWSSSTASGWFLAKNKHGTLSSSRLIYITPSQAIFSQGAFCTLRAVVPLAVHPGCRRKRPEKQKKGGYEQSYLLDRHSGTSPESNSVLTCDNRDWNRTWKNGNMNKRVIVCEISSWGTLAKTNDKDEEKLKLSSLWFHRFWVKFLLCIII